MSFPVCTILCFVLVSQCQAWQKPLRVFISVDLEGIAGVVDPVQLGPAGSNTNVPGI